MLFLRRMAKRLAVGITQDSAAQCVAQQQYDMQKSACSHPLLAPSSSPWAWAPIRPYVQHGMNEVTMQVVGSL